MSKIVKKTDDISSISNGEFVFCKELNKGFIKRDISSLDTVTFEGVVQSIEALDLGVLETLGLDSVQFGGNYDDLRGEMIISDKRSKYVLNTINNINDDDRKKSFIDTLLNNEKGKSRYFKSSMIEEEVETILEAASYGTSIIDWDGTPGYTFEAPLDFTKDEFSMIFTFTY